MIFVWVRSAMKWGVILWIAAFLYTGWKTERDRRACWSDFGIGAYCHSDGGYREAPSLFRSK